MKHFSDKTLDPDSGATVSASAVSDGAVVPEEAGAEGAPEAVPEVASAPAPDAALFVTRRLEDLSLFSGAAGGSEGVAARTLAPATGEVEVEVEVEVEGTMFADPPQPPPVDTAAADPKVEQPVVEEDSLTPPRPGGDGVGEAAPQNAGTARSESAERPSHLAAWWRRIRPAGEPRPLQINELALAAEEHLRAAAMPTLESLYLPSRVSFGLSEADWGNLMPFDDYIEKEIATVYARLLGEAGFASLVERPEIKVLKETELKQGDPPRVSSRFHRHLKVASWRPGQRGVAVRPKPPAAAELAESKARPEAGAVPGGEEVAPSALLEVLATPGAQQATARQSLRVLCLEETLPLALVDARAKPGECLHLDQEGRPTTADGSRWKGAPWEALPPIAELPELESPMRAEMAELPLLLIKPPGRSPVCWAPGGLLVIGRDPLRSNWVPDGAPTNLSGRHLVLAWVADEAALYALDLGSTNGVYQAGSRLLPLRSVGLKLPVCLSIGTEESLNLELYPVVVPGADVRRSVGRPAPRPPESRPPEPRSPEPRAQDDLKDLPLR